MHAMATSSNLIKSNRLASLAQQLRLYKPPPLAFDASPMTVPESTSAQLNLSKPDRFRHKTAAVLVCVFEDSNSDLRVILTKRSSNLSSHSGEVSLPGGKTEEGDRDEKETALREAKEEIGLDPSLVSVVAVLELFISRHLLRVTPVIAILHDIDAFRPVLNPAEVEEIFDAPLEMFLKEEKKESEERDWMGVKYLVHNFHYKIGNKKFLIWALTAGILIRAASVVYQRSPPFPVQSPEFRIPYPRRRI